MVISLNPQLVLSEVNTVHNFTHIFCNIYYNFLPPTSRSIKRFLSSGFGVYISYAFLVLSMYVTWLQCKWNLFLRCHGQTEWFCIVDKYLLVTNNTKGKHCCVFIPLIVTRTLYNITLYLHLRSCYFRLVFQTFCFMLG